MLFHTPKFLIFLLIVLVVYWALPRHRWRMGWLLAASCFFYISWNPWLISLILFSASVDYIAAQFLEGMTSATRRWLLLFGSIAVNLSLLAFFKYTNFFLDSVYGSLNLFGLEMHRHTLEIILPLGISFYTFETISYIVEVYQGRVKAVRNYLDYALYIMFFPHLIAGPIVRPRDFLPQIGRTKRFSWNRAALGVRFFLLGFFKKVAIADQVGQVADLVFKDPGQYSSGLVWLGVLSYAVQVYCDFSGYSDMAVGTAHLFGFKLPQNFNLPYLATSISDFWKRWHISLSSWLRDYIYIPLGGSRKGTWRTYRNLILTLVIAGIWHGANWMFVVFGLCHGLMLALQRAIPLPAWWSRPCFRPLSIAFTFVCVCTSYVIFRAQTFTDAGIMLYRMYYPVAGVALVPAMGMAIFLLTLVLICHWATTLTDLRRFEKRLPAPVLGALLALLLLAALVLIPDDGARFIYFQF